MYLKNEDNEKAEGLSAPQCKLKGDKGQLA